MIYVLATIELNDGTRDVFLQHFRENIPNVRAEPGCIEYVPAVDLPTGLAAQGEPRANVVVVVEKWESLAALRVHLDAPHMHAYRAKVKDLVRRVSLQVLSPADRDS